MQNDPSLQRSFLWLWISLFFTVISATIFQNLPWVLPGLVNSYLALKRVKTSSLVIRDANDQDLEMQPLEVSGQQPQLRKRYITVSQAFRMAFRKDSQH
mmetsp:Transcript_39994/g.96505  ORF Transcript_39994/g.96505 Transcript_39994/m.96505 type:complete len:99 (+) Transcript_39994:136-432(+)